MAKKTIASKIYTAQEIRETAENICRVDAMDGLTCRENCYPIKQAVCAMLRQAADMLDRCENAIKDYEYSIKYCKKNKCVGMSAYHYKTKEQAHNDKIPMAGEKAIVVRREVGKWEEVEDCEDKGKEKKWKKS